MKEEKDKFDIEERNLADKVADEILTVYTDDDDRKYFFLVLFFLICLIFLVASLSFAIFDTYYNGGNKNVVDVGIDVDIDGDSDSKKKPVSDSDDKKNTVKGKTSKIDPGYVVFSFNEKSSYINMTNVFPTRDDVGKKLSGNKEYFDFNVYTTFKSSEKKKIVYEISLLPSKSNSIKKSDVRVYLTEQGKSVSVLDNDVSTFSDLPDSKIRSGAKVIYKKEVSKSFNGNYVFRMWLSSGADVASVPLKFGCKVAVDAYFE